jgi:UDP-glucuronate decarboxylase
MLIKVVRIFNTFGPRMHPDDGRVVSNFIVAALQNRPITIYGDGRQTRSFCYVDDLIEAMLRMMESPKDLTGPINIGNPVETAIGTLAETIKTMTGSSSTITYHPLPTDDPMQRCPDISRAKTHLNWQPDVALETGLMRTIDYFRHLIAA